MSLARLLLAGLAWMLAACDTKELHRMAGVTQGTLVAGLGMPMSEVQRRSSLKLHKLPGGQAYADDAFFDFELADSSLRFKGCWTYLIGHEGPDETVTSIGLSLSPPQQAWPAFAAKMRGAASKLKADGWEPWIHDDFPTLESFLARDGSQVAATPSSEAQAFDWRKPGGFVRLRARHDGPRFWCDLEVARPRPSESDPPEAALWLQEFRVYPGAHRLCVGNVVSIPGSPIREINWTLYAAPESPAMVVAFYAVARGIDSEPAAARLGVEGKDGKRLSVHPVSDSYPGCGTPPLPGDKTVLVVSQALR